MKIRNGFVSNSSSTSFTFIWKGFDKSREPLYDLIKKYGDKFKLYYGFDFGELQGTSITYKDVIEEIKSLGKPNQNKYDSYTIDTIDDEISKVEKSLKEHKEWMKRVKKEGRHDPWYDELLKEDEDKLKNLKVHKKNGFTHAATIGFGDNHGNVCGGKVGNIMDYEGRYIRINEDDFVVFTEQNR